MADAQIYVLCNCCDNYNKNTGACSVVSREEQQRYADKKGCGFGSIQGIRASVINMNYVTIEGYPFRKGSKGLADIIAKIKSAG